MNLAVAFTEYQLIQIQSVVRYYNVNNLKLILLDNDRVQPWLIDQDLFDDIFVLPPMNKIRWRRILKSHIDRYDSILNEYIGNRKVNIFIGAQDENTIYALIKRMVSPKRYWSIEDGFANYYERNVSFRLSIWLKKKLFKYVYSYDLPIAYGHGRIKSEKSFRVAPELSTDKNNIIFLAPILKNYLEFKALNTRENFAHLKKYKSTTQLVVTKLDYFSDENNDAKYSSVYKFHPKDEVPSKIGVRYIKEKIPLEMLPFLIEDLKKIRFEVMSSSVLNILCMNLNIEIVIAFQAKSRPVKNAMDFIKNNYGDRVKFAC